MQKPRVKGVKNESRPTANADVDVFLRRTRSSSRPASKRKKTMPIPDKNSRSDSNPSGTIRSLTGADLAHSYKTILYDVDNKQGLSNDGYIPWGK